VSRIASGRAKNTARAATIHARRAMGPRKISAKPAALTVLAARLSIEFQH
jgi:hypothetical protein